MMSAHAEFVADLSEWLTANSDGMIEADGKERAVLRLRNGAWAGCDTCEMLNSVVQRVCALTPHDAHRR
jgi:hypothetical protein